TADDGFACAIGQTRACMTSCGIAGSQTCRADCSGYDGCRAPVEGPTAGATCNNCDDDLDGAIDEGFDCRPGESRPCTTHCGTSGLKVCGPACTYGSCIGLEECNYCDDDLDGDYADEQGSAFLFNEWDPDVCAQLTLSSGTTCGTVPPF